MPTETWYSEIELIGLDAPATVTRVNGSARWYGGPADGPVSLGDTVEIGSSLSVSLHSEVVLTLSDGKTLTLRGENDESNFSFELRARLEQPPENFWEEQLKGYRGLEVEVKAGRIDLNSFPVPMLGTRIPIDAALEFLQTATIEPIERRLAHSLRVVAIGEHGACVMLLSSEWTVSKCISVIELLQRPISPLVVSDQELETFLRRVYP